MRMSWVAILSIVGVVLALLLGIALIAAIIILVVVSQKKKKQQ